MVALSVVCFEFGRAVGVEEPLESQVFTVPVPGRKRGSCVVAAAHYCAGSASVQIGYCGKMPLAAVAVVVAPTAVLASAGQIIYSLEGGTGLAAEDGQILRSVHNPALKPSFAAAIVLRSVADNLPKTIDSAVCSFADKFGNPVRIKVIDKELSIVGAGPDVAAEVYSPQSFAAKFQTVDEDASGVARVGVVVGVRGVPLEENLVLSVAVGIAYRAVAGAVCGYLTVRHNLVGRGVQGDGNIVLRAGCLELPAAFRGLGRAGLHGIDSV